jgi:hypothetical protein
MSSNDTNTDSNGGADSNNNNKEAGNRLPFPNQRKYRDLENFEELRKHAEEAFQSVFLRGFDPSCLDELSEISNHCVARTEEHDTMIKDALRRINEAQCAADASFDTDQQSLLEKRAEGELQNALAELRFLLKPVAHDELTDLVDDRVRRNLEVLAETPAGRPFYAPMTEGDLRLELLPKKSPETAPLEIHTAPTVHMRGLPDEVIAEIFNSNLASEGGRRAAEKRLYKCFLKHAKKPEDGYGNPEALRAQSIRRVRTEAEEAQLREALREMNETQRWISERMESLGHERREELATAFTYAEGVHDLKFEEIKHLLQPVTIRECRKLIKGRARRLAHAIVNSPAGFPKKPDLTEDDLRLQWVFGAEQMDC